MPKKRKPKYHNNRPRERPIKTVLSNTALATAPISGKPAMALHAVKSTVKVYKQMATLAATQKKIDTLKAKMEKTKADLATAKEDLKGLKLLAKGKPAKETKPAKASKPEKEAKPEKVSKKDKADKKAKKEEKKAKKEKKNKKS